MTGQQTIAEQTKTPFLHAALLGILAVFCVLAMVIGDNRGWYLGLGVPSHTSDLLFEIVTGILLGAAAVSLLKAKFSKDVTNRIDEVQTQQRRLLIAITILIAGFGAMTILNPFHHNGTVSIDFAIEFALLCVAAAAAATFGVGFLRRRCRDASNDEFVQALRARAAQIGYMLAMAGLSSVYLIYLFRPRLMIVALPSALLIGVIAPAIYFLIAERSANA